MFSVKNVDSVVRTNPAEQLQAIVNFKTACCYENLSIEWGKQQIDAFLNILEKLYYTAPTFIQYPYSTFVFYSFSVHSP